jgi:hypothetical protein
MYSLAFTFSISACLSLGILTLFSILAEPLQLVMGYSQTVINKTIISQMLGLSIFTPLSGYIADAEGVWILSIISLCGYVSGFTTIIYIVKHGLHENYVYLCFFVIGCSHVSFLFSCLINSAKSIGRYYRTLSISTPNMMVSFSSYVQIQIIRKFFQPRSDEIVDVRDNFINLLWFFLSILIISTLLSFMACKITDLTENLEYSLEDSTPSLHEDFLNFETSPLLTGAATVLHSTQTSLLGSPHNHNWYLEEETTLANIHDELSMLSASAHSNPSLSSRVTPYKSKVNKFLKDVMMYPLLLCCLMSIGSTEFFISNLNAILSNLNLSKHLDSSLQTLSITSTVTRCIIMLFTDTFCTRFEISRLTIYTCCMLLCGMSHLYLSSTPVPQVNFALVVIFNSILNSAVFTLFPAILASIYGIEILGTSWGFCSSSSIFGNMFLNMLYSKDFGENCIKSVSGEADLVICSTLTFFISGSSLLLLGAAVFALRSRYLHRASAFF